MIPFACSKVCTANRNARIYICTYLLDLPAIIVRAIFSVWIPATNKGKWNHCAWLSHVERGVKLAINCIILPPSEPTNILTLYRIDSVIFQLGWVAWAQSIHLFKSKDDVAFGADQEK